MTGKIKERAAGAQLYAWCQHMPGAMLCRAEQSWIAVTHAPASHAARTFSHELKLFLPLLLCESGFSFRNGMLLNLCQRLRVDDSSLAGQEDLALDAKREKCTLRDAERQRLLHVCHKRLMPPLHRLEDIWVPL